MAYIDYKRIAVSPNTRFVVIWNLRFITEIKTAKETIIVMAFFSGTPKEDTPEENLDEARNLFLTSFPIELSDKRIAQFKDVKFAKEIYDNLKDPDIQVLINVYSGRESINVNLLDCDILVDNISNVAENKYILKGKLIGE